jgi:DNA methylase
MAKVMHLVCGNVNGDFLPSRHECGLPRDHKHKHKCTKCGLTWKGYGMRVHVSQLESRKHIEELLLQKKSGSGFGPYAYYYSFVSPNVHPFRTDVDLAKYLILRYTKKGDKIIEPMGGMGQTGLIAALHGRDVDMMEIEPKYYGYHKKMIRNLKRRQPFGKIGRIRTRRGDSTKDLLKAYTNRKYAACITSPPFSSVERYNFYWKDKKGMMHKFKSHQKRNIGGMDHRRHLIMVRKIYGNVFKMLKPGGVFITTVKAFNRHDHVVDYPYDTYKILKALGFNVVNVIRFRFPQLSLWTKYHYRRNPNLTRVIYGYVIIAKKP